MGDTYASERNARGLERFLLFTDAVVAIAITLLILPVVDAVSDSADVNESVSTILKQSEGQIYSFLLSFVVIALLWRAHHRVYEDVSGYSAGTFRAGLGWLLTIVFLPVTTALIADHSAEHATVLLYVGNVALSSLMLCISTLIVLRHPELRHSEPDAVADTETKYMSMLHSGLIALAWLLVYFIPAIGFASLFILFLGDPLESVLRRRLQRKR